ncbi:ac146 [Malacosoma neustria nucleopolyhedrovirus]|uniref:ac146 n=1 Tax=Malacosoma neustria nuclear polyhedrosis virus TaxID=38012 RepID=UPI000E35AEA4|nr:ac146 [Malacosoma neustria nucleopolyhedrovirus]AUF81538.1 ac146 [Malacosoma neustria nucleopolyhedrovirus]
MNVNLRYPPLPQFDVVNDVKKKLITFSLFDSINSSKVFLFAINDDVMNGNDTATIDTHTKLVSGYETGARSINMNMSIVNYQPTNVTSKDYFISCVRLPFVSTSLITNKHFSKPLSLLTMQTYTETQVWHIFTVRKGKEPITFHKIRGVSIWFNNEHIFYAKEVIRLHGNIPSVFITNLLKDFTNVKNVQQIKFICPNIDIRDDTVTIEIDK